MTLNYVEKLSSVKKVINTRY